MPDASGEGNGTPLQYSCLENPMDGGACSAAIHGVAKSRTGLSNFTFTFHFPALEKEMAPHSSILAWRIPGTGKPGGLLSMGSHRVRHDWSDLAAATAARLFHEHVCGKALTWNLSKAHVRIPQGPKERGFLFASFHMWNHTILKYKLIPFTASWANALIILCKSDPQRILRRASLQLPG